MLVEKLSTGYTSIKMVSSLFRTLVKSVTSLSALIYSGWPLSRFSFYSTIGLECCFLISGMQMICSLYSLCLSLHLSVPFNMLTEGASTFSVVSLRILWWACRAKTAFAFSQPSTTDDTYFCCWTGFWFLGWFVLKLPSFEIPTCHYKVPIHSRLPDPNLLLKASSLTCGLSSGSNLLGYAFS